MKTHKLKIWPMYYQAVLDGEKTFEVRNNDRGFQVGDRVILQEYMTALDAYTDRKNLVFKIGYVLKIPGTEYVAFSLLPHPEHWVDE